MLLSEGDAVGVHLIQEKLNVSSIPTKFKVELCGKKGEQEILADIKSFFTGCLDVSGLQLHLYRDQSAG